MRSDLSTFAYKFARVHRGIICELLLKKIQHVPDLHYGIIQACMTNQTIEIKALNDIMHQPQPSLQAGMRGA